MTNEDKKAIADAIEVAVKAAIEGLGNVPEIQNFPTYASDIARRAKTAAEQRLRRHTSSGRF